MHPAEHARRPVLVLDFGSQYVQLIARRVRERRAFQAMVREFYDGLENTIRHTSKFDNGKPTVMYLPNPTNFGRLIVFTHYGIHHHDIRTRAVCVFKADRELAQLNFRMGALKWNEKADVHTVARW